MRIMIVALIIFGLYVAVSLVAALGAARFISIGFGPSKTIREAGKGPKEEREEEGNAATNEGSI